MNVKKPVRPGRLRQMHTEYRAAGEPLPAVVPAGLDNLMGLYALYIGRLYAIHGTNANFGIGLRVSHGCVRLRNDDIKFLFENVPVGTRVQFIDEPVKATTERTVAVTLRCITRCQRRRRSLKVRKLCRSRLIRVSWPLPTSLTLIRPSYNRRFRIVPGCRFV